MSRRTLRSFSLRMSVSTAPICSALTEAGALFELKMFDHSYMHCWRHKTPIVYRATSQWFAGMDITPKDGGPTLRDITVQYLSHNQPPTVALNAPSGGDILHGTQTLRWTGSDPDKVTLVYDVSFSNDDGRRRRWRIGPE